MNRSRRVLRVMLAGVAALVLWWWVRVDSEPTPVSPDTSVAARSRTRKPSRRGQPEVPPPAQTEPAAVGNEPVSSHEPEPCEPHAAKGCHEGDVWWFDGCGEAHEPLEACDGRACLGVGCAPSERFESRCGSITALGRCDGELAQACVLGRVVTVDCARGGQRCVLGREGARCEAQAPGLCTGREPARCEGSRLVQCDDGHLAVTDCARRNAQCVTNGGRAHCEGGNDTPASQAERDLELCNQRDDDADDKVDEGDVCETVTLVPVVPAGANLPDLEARMQRELAIVNRVFQPRTFRWHSVLPAPEQLARFPTRELQRVSASLHATISAELSGKFFVPVLLAERLDLEPPKGGISTLPNNRCGGVRLGDAPAPPHGLIVLAEQRMPETLAHELGHYFGLCHTHEEVERFAVLGRDTACELSGDGICDTAFDPGPSTCRADATCAVLCDDPRAQPLGADVMSYYLGCRRGLSAEQVREVERNIALRRGWSRCADATACGCTPGDLDACPDEMSCRPVGAGRFGCALDGASIPGAGCRDGSDCSGGAICLSGGGGQGGRCARACLPAAPPAGCQCIDVGVPFNVCAEDLG